MIVTCEECTTSFQLDESRIPASGARVRCSRCKHAFFLAKPGTSESDAVHSIASQTAQDPNAGIPNPASDIANPGSTPDGDEEDWEFTEEIRVEADDEADFGIGSEFGEGFDADALSADTAESDLAAAGASSSAIDVNALADEATSSGLELDVNESAIATPDTGVEAGHDDSSFGTVEDFSSLDSESTDADVDALVESIDSGDAKAPEDPDPVGTYSQQGSSEELENPENWDLAPDADFSSNALGDLTESYRGGSGEASATEAEGEPAYYADELEESSALRSGLGHAAQAAGWAVTAAAIVTVAYLGFLSEWSRFNAAEGSLMAGAFAAETNQVGWLETSRTGSVFVVNGVVRNTGASVLRPPRLAVIALDANGNQLGEQTVFVGDPLSDEALRESDPTTLDFALTQARASFAQASVSSGGVRNFQAVIHELPAGSNRIALEVAD